MINGKPEEARMTRADAIERVGKVLLAKQGYRTDNWKASYPQVEQKATDLVDSLIALQLLKPE
jgi:hypothetical protein